MYVRAMYNAIRENSSRYHPGQIFWMEDKRRAQKFLDITPPMVKIPRHSDWQEYLDALKKNGEEIPEFVLEYFEKREATVRKARKEKKSKGKAKDKDKGEDKGGSESEDLD